MAGRSRRHVASEDGQRRDDIPADRDRCVFETGVVHSAEEQVGGVAGGRLQTVAKRRHNNRPTTLQTDKGSEFLNRPLQRLLKEYGVHHFATHNEETKASVVERFNRSLKTRMWRYFTKKQTIRYVDALQDFVRSYNDSYHRSIGMAPSAVNGANQETVWQRLYGHDGGGTPQVSSRRSRAHQQGETSLRERLHGELDGRIVYDRRSAPFGSARVSIGRLARR